MEQPCQNCGDSEVEQCEQQADNQQDDEDGEEFGGHGRAVYPVFLVALVLLVCNLLWAGVLAVFAGVAAILNGEGGAVVEAGKAEVAVAGTPYGATAFDGDELVGA